MSCSLWRWTEECDTHICVGDCDLCDYNNEDDENNEEACKTVTISAEQLK